MHDSPVDLLKYNQTFTIKSQHFTYVVIWMVVPQDLIAEHDCRLYYERNDLYIPDK